MARTEKDEGVTLVILRVPRYQGETSDIPYTTVPLGIIQTDRVVVTVCSFESDLIRGLTNGRVRNLSTSKRNRFLLHIFLVAAQQYLTYLRSINKTVDVLEDKLQLSLRNRELLELLKYQKSLTYFATGLKANELMMARLQKSQLFRMYPDDEELLEDALTEIGQAIEMTNISSGILSAMMDAFASIISNNLNVVMKILTSVTIILALPTMAGSIYGMNIDLPLQTHPLAFWYVIGAAVVVSIGVIVVFIRKDWL
jgi:magnesium transporter